jgi:hypothetical protein
VFFRYNQGVAWVYGVIAQKSNYLPVIVNSVCRRFPADDFTELARLTHNVLTHGLACAVVDRVWQRVDVNVSDYSFKRILLELFRHGHVSR